MAYQSAVDDIEDEISSWGYSTPLSNYQRSACSLENKPRGRGRGITNPCHMANIRLASEIGDMKAHAIPMGHMATTEELLAQSAENEITPMLRQLGISGHGQDISSKTTRKNPKLEDEIRLDGNLPIILNGDLFESNTTGDSDDGIEVTEKFDPARPLHEQFSTIPELSAIENDCSKTSADTNPLKKTKPNKSKNIPSDDSALGTSTSSSSTQAAKEKNKTKKKKWRKMTPAELTAAQPTLDRYEENYSIGVHDNAMQSVYAPRQLHGANGLKGWSAQY
ncbi:uncharacterized protein LOC129731440 isoform X2 [Wyeomyia smithii]|uniref:uncharacterized protein LOC129731440 isoform X2 n=1 Tax=Wyeomyia smithii TaxID=174621 RepID=UPI002467DA93|nr:uncharacterized protein LOC129731440 isoform X2 [Wyeomyia smithii]